MHQRQNTKHSTTGTIHDYDIFFTHGSYWVRLFAPWFSILTAHNRLFYKMHSSLPHKKQSWNSIGLLTKWSIIAILKTLEETQNKSWKDHVQKLVYASNCTKHSTTRYAPYFLLFGRKPSLPIYLLLEPTHKTTQQTQSKFVDDWRNHMSQGYKIASTNSSCRKRKDIARRQ